MFIELLIFLAIVAHVWSRNVNCENLMFYFKFQLFDCTLCEVLWDLRPPLRTSPRDVSVEIDAFDETPYEAPRAVRDRIQTPFLREPYDPPLSAVGRALTPHEHSYPARHSMAGITRDFDDPSSDSSY